MEKIKQQLAAFLSPLIERSVEEIQPLIEQPKNRVRGLLSLPVFSIHRGENPWTFAQKLQEKINNQPCSFIQETKALQGFLNFYFKKSYLLEVFDETFSKPSLTLPQQKKQKIVIDYSSPNVAKYMNVGHLRATVIGQTITNMARAFGHEVVALNHLGDWGTQFGKLIVAYQKWGDPSKVTLSHLVDLYVRFHSEAKTNENLNQQARQTFKKMEEGDPQLLKIWQSFVDISMKEYQKFWKKLGVQHDLVQGESFYRDQVQKVHHLLKKQNLLKESEGAQVVFLEKNMPPCLIQKSDGASTYSCRDLASIIYRFETLKATTNIYVAGVDHHLYFKQLKAVLHKVNPQWDQNTRHLSFGMYRFKGQGKFSSRKGQSVALEDLIQQSKQKVLSIIEEKNPSLEDKDQISDQISIGALIFNDLMNDRVKDVNFSWEKALDFDGDSGPFVQYCYVRCLSLFKNLKTIPVEWKASLKDVKSLFQDIEESEWEWIEKLLEFDTRALQAFSKFKPHILATFLLELCHVFSRFYSKNRIINSPKQDLRLYLTYATQNVLKKGLNLLGLQAPSSM